MSAPPAPSASYGIASATAASLGSPSMDHLVEYHHHQAYYANPVSYNHNSSHQSVRSRSPPSTSTSYSQHQHLSPYYNLAESHLHHYHHPAHQYHHPYPDSFTTLSVLPSTSTQSSRFYLDDSSYSNYKSYMVPPKAEQVTSPSSPNSIGSMQPSPDQPESSSPNTTCQKTSKNLKENGFNESSCLLQDKGN